MAPPTDRRHPISGTFSRLAEGADLANVIDLSVRDHFHEFGKDLTERLEKRDEKFDTRLKILEEWRWKLLGSWAVLAVLVAVMCTVTGYLIVDQVRSIKSEIQWRTEGQTGRIK